MALLNLHIKIKRTWHKHHVENQTQRLFCSFLKINQNISRAAERGGVCTEEGPNERPQCSIIQQPPLKALPISIFDVEAQRLCDFVSDIGVPFVSTFKQIGQHFTCHSLVHIYMIKPAATRNYPMLVN